MNSTIETVGRLALANEHVSRSDIMACIQASQDSPNDLFYWANRVRTQNFANRVTLCSIVAGKVGKCSQDCKWCAQSKNMSHDMAAPSITPVADMISAARDAAANESSRISIVNSGLKPTARDLGDVAQATGEITQITRSDNLREGRFTVCASLGKLDEHAAAELAAAGVSRYHHNLETSSRMYGQMVSTSSYDERLETLRLAREAGMKICSGGIFGMGETWEDRIDLAEMLRDVVQADSVPLNFLNPIPGSALENLPTLKPIEALRIIAVYRLMLPNVDLRMGGGREITLRSLQNWMYYAGITGGMIGNYLTTTGSAPADDLAMIKDLGLQVVDSFDADG